MQDQTKVDLFLERLTAVNKQYTPFSRSIHDGTFYNLEARLIDVENWDCAVEVERDCFEGFVGRNEDLAFEYVELFSLDAVFYLIEFSIAGYSYEFYMMLLNKRIELTFFKKSF